VNGHLPALSSVFASMFLSGRVRPVPIRYIKDRQSLRSEPASWPTPTKCRPRGTPSPRTAQPPKLQRELTVKAIKSAPDGAQQAAFRRLCEPVSDGLRTSRSNKRDQPHRSTGCILDLGHADDERCAGRRHLVQVGDVLQTPTAGWQPNAVGLKVLRGPVVER